MNLYTTTRNRTCVHGAAAKRRGRACDVTERRGTTMYGRVPRLLLVAVLLLVSLAVRRPVVLYAQATTPQLTITGIDVIDFPQVKVTVYGENLGAPLTEVPLGLSEDSVPKVSSSLDPIVEATGAQTLLVIDTYAGITQPGMTGVPRIQEVTNAVQQLTAQQFLLPDKDWIGFVSFDNSGDDAVPQVFAPWNRTDHQAVVNAVLQYANTQIENAKPRTALFDLLYTSLVYFDDPTPQPQNQPRSIVVFSNGFDAIAVAQKEDLVRLALDRDVRIHTVQFGAIDDPEAQRNMQNLALNTGGRYVHLTEENALLEDLWAHIQASQSQRVLIYRSDKPRPGELTVTAEAGVLRHSATRAFPAIDIRAPRIEIVRPVEETLTKSLPGDAELLYNTPVDMLEPKTIDLGIEVSWPDSYDRQLTRVEYIVADRTVVLTEAPFESVTFPIGALDEGDYTIRVNVVDELGMRAEAEPKPLSILVNRPDPPDISATATVVAAQAAADVTATAVALAPLATATAEAVAASAAESTRVANVTATALAEERRLTNEEQAAAATRIAEQQAAITEGEEEAELLRYLIYGGYGLGVLALAFAAFVWFNPRTRRRATEFVTGTVDRFTEFWSPEGVAEMPARQLRARLIPSDTTSNLGALDIYGGSTRVGRDSALATLVIDDRRVSRYHASIQEEGSGIFRLRDEGSTSGTYVNTEPVNMAGRILQPGDLVNFGPVQFRFEPYAATDATEPFTMTPPTEPAAPYSSPGQSTPTQPADASESSGYAAPAANEMEQYTHPRRGSEDATQISGDFDAPTRRPTDQSGSGGSPGGSGGDGGQGSASSDDRTRA